MRQGTPIYLLTEIHRLDGGDAQRAAFRRAMADLAAMGGAQRPVPLEGLDPDALSASVTVCMASGFLDDLSFLSSAAAVVALYQLAAALPKGKVRSVLGRRVVSELLNGDAQTFATLAATLAMASRDPFASAELRARVALVLELPAPEDTAVDALALSLLARPQMLREWVLLPANRSLATRRLAARILERAARQATRMCRQGDDAVLELFRMPVVAEVWQRLLADRESLVWRHVAVARGYLSTVMHEHDVEVTSALDPGLSPTEWRRAAVSAIAAITQTSQESIARCADILHGPLRARDPGLLGVMVFGVGALAGVEPRLAEELLLRLVEHGGDYAIENLVDLVHEGEASYAMAARMAAMQQLSLVVEDGSLDEARRATARLRITQLASTSADDDAKAGDEANLPLPHALHRAQLVYAQRGPEEAFAAARQILEDARHRIERLEQCAPDPGSLPCLWEVDATLLQTSALENLLHLSTDADSRRRAQEQFEALRERLHTYLLNSERGHSVASLNDGTSMRRLISLLHAVDVESGDVHGKQRQRQLETMRTLLLRASDEKKTSLGRVLCATLARASDALVRDEVLELSDVLLVSARYVPRDAGIRVLAEASMDPQMESVLHAYADLVAAADALNVGAGDYSHTMSCLSAFIRAMPVAGSPRVEALRRVLLEVRRSLEIVAVSPSLAYLCDENGAAAFGRLVEAVRGLHQLQLGTMRRVFDVEVDAGPSESASCMSELPVLLERSLATTEAVPWRSYLASLAALLVLELPSPIALLIRQVIEEFRKLPRESMATVKVPPLTVTSSRRLPAWLPPSRMIGGFYVVDTLGAGAVGSVFVATRAEDRGRPGAPRFALKVPTYDAQTAGTLSEEEFLAMFRKEAGALLALPHDHPNLASFVTFDAGARPKPLLVMELVSGPTLARLLARRQLETATVLSLLADVVHGLTAMHGLGIGHLDVKPSNIIVCRAEDAAPRAVLVDFGLSGRALRPSCATAAYGAPEVWGLLPEPGYSDPRPSDVYAFACTAFEMLTGRDIFSGADDMAIIAAHLRHDGRPEPIAELGENSELQALAELLTGALRQDPRRRISIVELSSRLHDLMPMLSQQPWPLLPRSARRAA